MVLIAFLVVTENELGNMFMRVQLKNKSDM